MNRILRVAVLGVIAASLPLGLTGLVPAQGGNPATAPTKALCKLGNGVAFLGIAWECEKSGSAYVWVISGPDLTQNSAKGGPGPCTIGDFVTLGGWQVTCRSVGGRAKWTQGQGPTEETFKVWGGSKEIPGVCAAGSWFNMQGRKIECAAGSGAGAWSVGPAQTEVASTNVSGELCAGGATTSSLGMTWTCTQLGAFGERATAMWVANGTSKTVAPKRQGAIGQCAKGDRLTIGPLNVTCASLGSRDGWTHSWNGSNATEIRTVVHRNGQRIPGTCRKGSWIQLDGVRITCTGTKAGATTTKAVKPAKSTKPSVVTVSVPGMTKQACINAWWDKEFAGVVPQLIKRQDQALTDRIWFACHQSYAKFMTAAERDSSYADFYGKLGQLVADEVQRVSASTGQNPCQAVETVLRPRYQPGFGLMGWDQSGFLPILYKQWQGGPIIGKLSGNRNWCATGEISVQFRRHYEGRHEGAYFPALGTPDATWPITPDEMQASWVKGATCLVWSPQFGNHTAGSAARVIGYNYTNMGFDGNMVTADFEVTTCEFKIAEAAGLPVVWKANPNLNDLQTVSADYAGVWHTMGDSCSWSLEQSDTGSRLSWSPADGPYTSFLLKTGDRFASTCKLQKTDWEHMVFAPDGLMPLQTLSPGSRRPSTPGTCRYLVTDWSALRNPPSAASLTFYAGTPVSFDTNVSSDGTSKVLRSVGCGRWELT